MVDFNACTSLARANKSEILWWLTITLPVDDELTNKSPMALVLMPAAKDKKWDEEDLERKGKGR